jgi:hypothetical protein
MSALIRPSIPFVWPEPRVSAGLATYAERPLDDVVRSAASVFGVASAIDRRAVDWIEGFLAEGTGDTKLRLVISIQPACRTSASDLRALLQLAERHSGRAAFRLRPEVSVLDRASNLLCFTARDGSVVVAHGPTENLGFGPVSASQANFVSSVSPAALEACRKWFDYLWAESGPLVPDLAEALPQLGLPEGDAEAALQWDAYRRQCLSPASAATPASAQSEPVALTVLVDPDTAEVTIKDQNGQKVESPTEALGVPRLDALAEGLVRVYERGMLVTVEKASRVPPLEAPVKPEWFGVDSFRQTGMVSSRTSFKVSPFDEATLKKIDRLRCASGDLLLRYAFALADGMRWIPKAAIPLFEAALTAANNAARELLLGVVGEDLDGFLASQRDRIRADAQRMYEGYHPGGKIPEQAVDNIVDELKARLGKARGEAFLPKVAYSPVAFHVGADTPWSSPWGQAFHLLKGIAMFPRAAMTDRYFWRSMRTDENELITAMDVVGDVLVAEYGSRRAAQRAMFELEILKALEAHPADARERCAAVWALLTTGDERLASDLIQRAEDKLRPGDAGRP